MKKLEIKQPMPLVPHFDSTGTRGDVGVVRVPEGSSAAERSEALEKLRKLAKSLSSNNPYY